MIVIGFCLFCLDNVDFFYFYIFDSDMIFELDEKLKLIIVYGVGVIGCEYVLMFCNMDIKINLVNMWVKLFEFFDDEIIDVFSYYMCDWGILIWYNE